MKIAYLDCFSGISGDMFLGALLDAGLSLDALKAALGSLPLAGYRIDIKREGRKEIYGTRFLVTQENEGHGHRTLKEIQEIVRNGKLNSAVQDRSVAIFDELARSEGRIHNRPKEEVHFHEVGSIDSIIDIVGAVYGVEALGIRKLFASSLPLGSGFAESAHGRLPVPAPATVDLLRDIPVFDAGIPFEMVTPTGAALLKCLVSSFGKMPPMIIKDVGYGIGKRDLLDRPNLLRILIGDDQVQQEVETVLVLETNLDDTSPEFLGYLMDRLFEAGALDVAFCPVQMKKNRPGVQLQVIGRPDQGDTLMEILFRESTALGIRFEYSQRRILERSIAEISSPWGKIGVKKVVHGDGRVFFMPEYESCREVASKYNRPLRDIFYWIMGLNRDE
jgi:uncharacterized protein (TIGR00299 family) protein